MTAFVFLWATGVLVLIVWPIAACRPKDGDKP